jgi:ribosomal protein L13E
VISPKNLATHKIKSRQTKAGRAIPLKVLIRNPPKTQSTTSHRRSQAKRGRNRTMEEVNKLGSPNPPIAKVTKMARLEAWTAKRLKV